MRRLADCSRWTPALLVLALALPGVADARKKNPYEGKLYNGQTIEGYCAGLLGVEAFDLTDEDLAICDKRYSQELDALDDITLGDIQLDGDGPRRSEVLEEEAEPREPKVSKKELEERRLAEEEAKRKKMDDLGLVEFEEEAPADDGGDDDDEEDDLLGDNDLDDDDLDEEEDFDIAEDDMLIEEYDEGGGSVLDDLEDDFGEDPSDTKKDKKKDKKKKDKKKKGGSDSLDDALDIPDEWN